MSATTEELIVQVRENLGQPNAPSSGKWSDANILQKMNNRIMRMNRWFKIKTIDTSITVDTTSFEYDYPTDIVNITKVEVWNGDEDVNRGEVVNWKTWSEAGTKKLIFKNQFDNSSDILKIFGEKRLDKLTATETTDVPLEVEELIVLGATIDCIRDLYRRRIDMTRYLADVQRQSGSTIDISRAIADYEREYNEIFSRIKTHKVQKLTFGM